MRQHLQHKNKSTVTIPILIITFSALSSGQCLNANKNNKSCSTGDTHTRTQVKNVRVVVSPLFRGPGNIHGFNLDGKSYRQRKATAQTLTVPTVSGVRIRTTPLLSRATGGALSLVRVLCLNNNNESINQFYWSTKQ